MNLIQVFWLKEKVFWKRTWTMKRKLSLPLFIIAIVLIAISHYAFALMHFLFECFLWMFWKSMFKANLQKLQRV